MQNADDSSGFAEPLSLAQLDEIFSGLLPLRKLLLAVSGGADSLGLMVLCAEWVKARKLPLELFVASVDHGLRPEAGDECAYIADLARTLGLPHKTLVWQGNKTAANLQAAAREARYDLLENHAASIRCDHIAVAHHMDDQAETVIMRLLRGSGVTGLAAMRPSVERRGVTILRPLLSVRKAQLVASLRSRGIEWVEDPSNKKSGFMRVRVRNMMPTFAKEGADAERLAATARRLQRADDALEQVASEFFDMHVFAGPGHSLHFDLSLYASLAEEFRLRLLRRALVFVAGPSYPPREERLMALDAALVSGAAKNGSFKRTLGGCCFEQVSHRVWIYREDGRDFEIVNLNGGEPVDWLGLYKVRVQHADHEAVHEPLSLRALGSDGRRLLLDAGYSFSLDCWMVPSLPRHVVEALPSVWSKDRPIAVVDWPFSREETNFRVVFEEKVTKSVSKSTVE